MQEQCLIHEREKTRHKVTRCTRMAQKLDQGTAHYRLIAMEMILMTRMITRIKNTTANHENTPEGVAAKQLPP